MAKGLVQNHNSPNLSSSKIKLQHELRHFAEDEGQLFSRSRRSLIVNWALVTVLGISCGVIGFSVHTTTYVLVDHKTSQTATYLHSGRWSEAFIIHFSYGFLFAAMAYACVFFDISAAGSGLPEVKR